MYLKSKFIFRCYYQESKIPSHSFNFKKFDKLNHLINLLQKFQSQNNAFDFYY